MGLHMHGDQTLRNFTLLNTEINIPEPLMEPTNVLGPKKTVCEIFFVKFIKICVFELLPQFYAINLIKYFA